MTDEPRLEDTAADTPEATATADTPETTATAEQPAKLHQQVEFRDIGPCKKHIKVTVERDDILKRLNDKFSELVVDAQVRGFRPGKAPRQLIERQFRKDVNDQVRAEILLQSLEQLAEDHDVAPLTAPDIDPTKIDIPKEGPMIYEFEVEVRPQFDLPDWRGLKLKRPVKTFTEEDVLREERRLLEPHGQLVPKPDAAGGAPVVESGDLVVADITTKDGDRLIGQIKEAQLRVEPRLVFKDAVAAHFGEQIQGAKPGETRTVDITLSEASADAALRGKTVQGVVEVKDIKTYRLPEITHELMHHFGVHSREQLHEAIRVALDRRLEYQQRQSARQQVLQHITAAATWELPEEMLRRHARSAFDRRVMEMREAGISDDQIRARQVMLSRDVLESTKMALKEQFVLQKLAEVEKLDVSEDDMNDAIENIARQYDEAPRRIRARLEKEDMMDALAAEIIERKALDLILQSAEYEDVPLDQAESATVATVEEQAVPGEMADPTAPPPAEEKTEPTAQS